MNKEDFEWLSLTEAENKLREMGFINFEYSKITENDSLEIDNKICSVEIKTWKFGKGDFSLGDTFDKSAIVVLWYYAYEGDSEKIENLTIENNSDLAILVMLKDPCDPLVSQFASTYSGQIIEFDGCIANIQNHDNYDTRYDILINTGNYDPNTTSGPNFRFTDVNAQDMDLHTLYLTDVLSV